MLRSFLGFLLVSGLCCAAETVQPAPPFKSVIWQAPRTATTEDWIWGPGGEQNSPVPPFQFIEENMGGTNPKVEIQDARGARWTVKFGGEVHAEVFASRLLFVTGYFAEPVYFVRTGQIVGARDLKRARQFIGKDGDFRNGRFKLRDKRSYSYADNYKWSWVENPFVFSRQLNGLKILMMLLSNWDAKDARDGGGSNTAVFLSRSDRDVYWYAFTDWGASLGSWGGFFKRARWDSESYERQTQEFIKGVQNSEIVWGFSGKHSSDIANSITVDDVRWILQYLSPITDEQLRAGLAASGATPSVAGRFSRAIRNRLTQLEKVASSND